MNTDTWVPDNPPERQYSCPGCNKGVIAKRVGESSSYVIEHPGEKKGDDGKCKYKGSISPKLLGYQPTTKVKTNDAHTATEADSTPIHSTGTSPVTIDRASGGDGSVPGNPASAG